MLVVLLLGGTAVAYDQTDVVKDAVGDAVGNIGTMFEDKGPPEIAVDENPLLREHGARILVASSPPGAKVFLDGKEQGITPVALTGSDARRLPRARRSARLCVLGDQSRGGTWRDRRRDRRASR